MYFYVWLRKKEGYVFWVYVDTYSVYISLAPIEPKRLLVFICE